MPVPVGVGVLPDPGAVAQVPVGPSVGERRVGKQRGGNRLQGQRGAEFSHHVGLGTEIQVDLHRGGARHHVEPERADLLHVLPHDAVARLGHPLHVLAAPLGLEAHAQERNAQRFGYAAHLPQVRVHLGAGLVDVVEQGA
jgi:hypothetical protein